MSFTQPLHAQRLEGRLYAHEGRLHYVLQVDSEKGYARVSHRADAGPTVEQVPISELVALIASAGELKLDGLHTSAQKRRIKETHEGWFFSTREGLKGPLNTRAEAEEALNQYINATQGPGAQRREA